MKRLRRHVPLLASLAVYVLLYAVAANRYYDDNFLSLRVFVNFFSDNAALGVVAIGMTFVILSGGIDLSVGSVVAMCGIVIAVLMQRGWSPPPAFAAALALGTLLGLGMGGIIHRLGIAPFIVTLAGLFFARGLALIIHTGSLPIHHPTQTALSDWGIPLTDKVSLPLTAVVFLVLCLLGTYVSLMTRFGRSVYAIGGNEESARLMGLRVGRTKILVYGVSGFCAALGAVLATVYQLSGNSRYGVGMELDAIAAVVVGGTLLTGGVGTVPGTLVGVLIFAIIKTGIDFEGDLDSAWTRVAIGLLLLIFIVLQRVVAGAGRAPSARPG
ncbi:MAG: sugar ABC transporter permease YjfF [Phycisphaerales bacterium]|nr:MAG: sugar ABC transporter permease YjfF [Phycisphaerales bacterium]